MKERARAQAEILRKKGESIKAIARTLDVSPSTVSRWCKKISLSPTQRLRLENYRKEAGLAALAPWIEKNKRRKKNDIKRQQTLGEQDIGRLSKRDQLLLGLGLYWGEGYKRGSQEWGFTNSDPAIIRAMLRWLERCYGIDRKRMNARVTINVLYEARALQIMRAWSRTVGIPLSQFSTPSFITGYGKPGGNARTYRGTLRLKVRNGTSLRRRILASINAASIQI